MSMVSFIDSSHKLSLRVTFASFRKIPFCFVNKEFQTKKNKNQKLILAYICILHEIAIKFKTK